MPRQILIFSSVEEAKSKLKSYSKNFSFPTNDQNKEDLRIDSVRPNVFRALSSSPTKPSVLYRDWFSQNFEDYISDINRVESQLDYDKLIFHYTALLIDYWNSKNENFNKKIGFGPASKIINLIGKMVNESSKYDIRNVVKFLHVPFDLYSLKPLREIINELTNVTYGLKIPSNVSMGYIINKEHYEVVQSAVFKLCENAGIMPIVYDYWSWNDTH